MEDSNPPLRQSNIKDIKAQVSNMIANSGVPSTPSTTRSDWVHTLYTGDSSVNSITLSESVFNYEKVVLEGYYMGMGSTAMDISVSAEWYTNQDYRKIQFTATDIATGSTPAVITTADIWEFSEDGKELDLVSALKASDAGNIVVDIETTSQITITAVKGYRSVGVNRSGAQYDVPYFDGGEYGAIAYLDAKGEVAYYEAQSANELTLANTSQSYTIVTLEDGYKVVNSSLLAYSFPKLTSGTKTLAANFLKSCPILQNLYNFAESRVSSIGTYFCAGASNFNQSLDFPDTLTAIGDFFFQSCITFNQPLQFPSALRSIGNSFLTGAYSFNSPIQLNEGLQTIGNGFMANATAFNQPIVLPDTLTGITSGGTTGTGFLAGAIRFNSPLSLSASLTAIPSYFLYNCTTFNQVLSVPSTIIQIGAGFLENCKAFNRPVNLSNTLITTGIGTDFMRYCSNFNSALTLPPALRTIPYSFLGSCTAFNQPLNLPKTVTSIYSGFMYNCAAFNQPLTLPPFTLYGYNSTNGQGFLYDCSNFVGPLTIEGTYVPTGGANYTLSQPSTTGPSYTEGITITGPGAAAWKAALPDSSTSPYRKLILAEETTV